MSKSNISDEIYSGASTVGLWYTFIGAIISSIMGVCMIIVAITKLRSNKKQYNVEGTVIKINENENGQCAYINTANDITYDCTLTVQYTDPSSKKTYTNDISYNGSEDYTVGSKIELYYTNDIQNVTADKNLSNGFLMFIVFVGLFFIIGGWLLYWASKKWKFFAAFQGAAGMMKLIR
jgi:hypothetical protein